MKKNYEVYMENPKLYDVAKEVTLEAGFPWTDPRTLETTQPPKRPTNMKKLPIKLEKRAQQIVEVWKTPISDKSLALWTKLLNKLTKRQQSLVIFRAEYLRDHAPDKKGTDEVGAI